MLRLLQVATRERNRLCCHCAVLLSARFTRNLTTLDCAQRNTVSAFTRQAAHKSQNGVFSLVRTKKSLRSTAAA